MNIVLLILALLVTTFLFIVAIIVYLFGRIVKKAEEEGILDK